MRRRLILPALIALALPATADASIIQERAQAAVFNRAFEIAFALPGNNVTDIWVRGCRRTSPGRIACRYRFITRLRGEVQHRERGRVVMRDGRRFVIPNTVTRDG